MSVSATYKSNLTIRETLTAEAAGTPTITHSGFDSSKSLSASTTPAVTKCIARTLSLSTGALTIDLTSLTGTNSSSVTLSGLKIQMMKIKNIATHAITIAKGASNGYTGFGSAFSITIPAGAEMLVDMADGSVAVSGSVKTLDVTGTGTDSFDIELLA